MNKTQKLDSQAVIRYIMDHMLVVILIALAIITALGTGNKRDAQQLRIADISQTEGCPLARVVRKELRKRGISHHKVVFSPELARSAEDGDEAPPPGRRSIPASAMWVPAAAGLLLAQAIILDLADGQGDGPTPS